MNEFCSREILRYSDIINRHEVSNYSVSELIEFLQHSDGDANFSEFAANFIAQMIKILYEAYAPPFLFDISLMYEILLFS